MKNNKENNLKVDGFKAIYFPLFLKKKIQKSIIKTINDKAKSIDKKYLEQKNIKKISKYINSMSQKNFLKIFGHVSYRYLEVKIANEINQWVKNNMKKKLETNRLSLHYSCVFDRKVNKRLKEKQFCIYFRCVRPKSSKDVGELHRDIDFWRLIKKREIPKAPINFKEIFRIWIPISGCSKENSLRFFKKSHLDQNIKTKYYKKNGRVKPILEKKNIKSYKKSYQPINNFKNEAILFSDRVVHYAPINKNINDLRLSVECSVVTN